MQLPPHPRPNEPLVNGSATSPGVLLANSLGGTDYRVATYNGDASTAAVTSGCTDAPVTITGS